MPGEYPLEELASLPSFYHPTPSPSGDAVAAYYDGTGRNELYLLDPEDREMTRVSDGDVPRNARYPFRWSADGDRLYFHRDAGGDEQNDILAIDREGAVEPVVENDSQCLVTDVGPDDSLLFVSDAGQQLNLYAHDPATGETTQLTEYRLPVRTGRYGPDGDRIAYTANETDDLDNQDVYVAAADGSDPRRLPIGESGAEATVADWHPDGDRLLVGDNATDKPRVGIYDLAADEARWLTASEHVESPVAVLPDGSGVLATRTRECMIVPVVYDLADGSAREFAVPEGVASFPGYGDAFLSGTEVLVTQTTPTDRSTLLAYDVETDQTRTLLAPEYGDLDPDGFVDASYHAIESHDGLEIEALVYDSGRRPSPAVVKVHGGPPAQDRQQFDLYAQFLATRGYTVLEVNYRGSIGRGREFKNAINGDWGGAEQGDIAAGVQWLAETEWIDEDRIAVFGGSYGGYSAYMQLLQYPELYAAGIAWIGMTDLGALYEESMPHFKTALERYLGDPEDNAELYRERSPVTHAENLAAPLCIIHGVNDSRVPIEQARLFRDRLEELGYEAGADFELNELGAEGHGSTDIDQKIRAFGLLADFLDRRVPVGRAETAD
ncbi:S9 family peptidase [Halobacteriales archaeon QH_10_67_13]|nr:MAG: S9 family peptidase [Halobacteriales archaeon QH_10_67_13]